MVPSKAPLAPGWFEAFAADNQTYYFDAAGNTRWARPVADSGAQAAPAAERALRVPRMLDDSTDPFAVSAGQRRSAERAPPQRWPLPQTPPPPPPPPLPEGSVAPAPAPALHASNEDGGAAATGSSASLAASDPFALGGTGRGSSQVDETARFKAAPIIRATRVQDIVQFHHSPGYSPSYCLAYERAAILLLASERAATRAGGGGGGGGGGAGRGGRAE